MSMGCFLDLCKIFIKTHLINVQGGRLGCGRSEGNKRINKLKQKTRYEVLFVLAFVASFISDYPFLPRYFYLIMESCAVRSLFLVRHRTI